LNKYFLLIIIICYKNLTRDNCYKDFFVNLISFTKKECNRFTYILTIFYNNFLNITRMY
jgi:hypothetical protein